MQGKYPMKADQGLWDTNRLRETMVSKPICKDPLTLLEEFFVFCAVHRPSHAYGGV